MVNYPTKVVLCFRFNQRYHEEFRWEIEGNRTLEIKDSATKTGIFEDENCEIYVYDEAVVVDNSDIC